MRVLLVSYGRGEDGDDEELRRSAAAGAEDDGDVDDAVVPVPGVGVVEEAVAVVVPCARSAELAVLHGALSTATRSCCLTP